MSNTTKVNFLFAGLFLLAYSVCAQPQQPLGYTNPIITGMNPDPSICCVGEDYYLVTSSFVYFPGVPIYHSNDLVNWQLIGYCLSRTSQLDLTKTTKGIYALTFRYHKGIFYMVTTNPGKGGNFYVTAKNTAGPWSEPIWLKQEGIDPSLFFDEDGTAYFTSTGQLGIQQSTIDVGTGQILTNSRYIWTGTGGRYPESPHLYKLHGMYYLLLSEGETEYGHMVTMARSTSPWGPFEPCPHNPILTHRNKNAQSNPIQGVGHADLLEAHDGSWWMVFLGFRQTGSHHHIGRETFLSPLVWTNELWPVLPNGGTTSEKMNVATLPPHPVPPLPSRDDFDGQSLALEWNFLKNPNPKSWSLPDRKGWLRLTGSARTLNDPESPTFIGRRQKHLDFQATALIDFTPKDDSEEAGLTVFHRTNGYYDLFLQKIGPVRCVVLRYYVGRIVNEEKRVALKEGPVQVRVSGTPTLYTFSYAQGAEFRTLGSVETRFLSSETLGRFLGNYLGLYASGNGKESDTPAYVDWFEYLHNSR